MNLPPALNKYLKEKYWFLSLEKDRIKMYKIDQALREQNKRLEKIEKLEKEIKSDLKEVSAMLDEMEQEDVRQGKKQKIYASSDRGNADT